MPFDTTCARWRSVAITGASCGLGAALARALAAPGRQLGLLARGAGALDAVSSDCRDRGATVIAEAGDVTRHGAAAAWLARLEACRPLDLVVVNAGIFDGIGADGRLEPEPLASSILRTNLEAAIATASAAASLMQPRRAGHIAIISSLAARYPLADAPVYSASKAGLAAYADALRERLQGEHGIRVSLVLPGHLDTAQVARHRGPLPFLLPAEAAAEVVLRRLAQGHATIAFPWQPAVLTALARTLPWRWRAWAGRGTRFTVDAPLRDSR